MIIVVIIGIAIISVGLSLWSLRSVRKMQEVEKARDDLSRSKVLFHSDSVSSSQEDTPQTS